MKLKIGESSIPLGRFIDDDGYVSFAVYSNGDPQFNPCSYLMAVPRLHIVEFMKRQKDSQEVRGVPVAFAIGYTDKEHVLHIWPSPDKEMAGRLRFNPPVEEI